MLQIFFFSIACYMIINCFLSGTGINYILALLTIALFLAVIIARKK